MTAVTKTRTYCRTVDDIVDAIINGRKPVIGSNSLFDREKSAEIRAMIRDHEDNVDCMYYMTILLHDQKDEYEKYLQKAIQLGSLDAKFDYLAAEYFSRQTKEVLAELLELIRNGYRFNLQMIGRRVGVYAQILSLYIRELERENRKLQEKLVHEQLRPPEVGGSEFEKCKTHFLGVAPRSSIETPIAALRPR